MKLFNYVKNIYSKYKQLKLDAFITKEEIEYKKTKKYFFFGIMVLLSIFNLIYSILTKNENIIFLSIVVTLGFATSLVFVRFIKNLLISDALAAFTLVVGITLYLRYGFVNPFNVLWILVVPVIMFMVMSVKVSCVTNIYVLLYLFICFYTPLYNYLGNVFPDDLRMRFPFIYLVVLVFAGVVVLENDMEAKLSSIHTYIDDLTGLSNRSYYNLYVGYMQRQGLTEKDIVVVSLDVNSLKSVNDELGHNYGDQLLKGAGEAIENAFKNAELIGRIGGDEFIVISYENEESIKESFKQLENACSNWNNDKINSLSISKGYALSKDHPYINPEKLYKIADEYMYKDKSDYYIKNNINRRKTSN